MNDSENTPNEKSAANATGYNRVLLKISGEALMGENDYGIDFETIARICADVKLGEDIFDMRGIDRSQGCIVVVRPDQLSLLAKVRQKFAEIYREAKRFRCLVEIGTIDEKGDLLALVEMQSADLL